MTSSGTSSGSGDDGGNSEPGEGGTAGCGTAVFCDGFEGSATLDSNWTPDANNPAGNTVKVVTTMAHSGTNSVELSLAAKSGATFIDEKMGFPIAGGDQWGRVWLYVNTPTDNGHDVYIEASTGMATMNNGVRPLNTEGGTMATNVDPQSAAGGEATGNSGTALPKMAWTCFEWHIGLTGMMGSLELYVGGTALAKTAVTFTSQGNAAVGSLVETRIGYENYNGAATASTIYVDDFAIGTAQIGCM
ncbi:MAG: hypothetical protein ABSC94_24130 [Polyangiaceae bacterium]|jgi:hypothetical protein